MRTSRITIPYGATWLVGLIFDLLGLDRLLDGLKRNQGLKVSEIARALVAFAITDRGLSVKSMEETLCDPNKRLLYGLKKDISRNDLYRTLQRLGIYRYHILRYINRVLKSRIRIGFQKIYVDWSASYIDGKSTAYIRFGHTKDHRPDRPQVSYGIAVDADSGIPIGLTVERGNINDNVHFRRTFGLIRGNLRKGAEITFDAGAHGKINTDMLNKKGFRFLTRVTVNDSDDKRINDENSDWKVLKDGTKSLKFESNLGYTRVIFFSEKRKKELLASYKNKAESDYEKMTDIQKSIENGNPPQKKYRNSNCFVETHLSIKEGYLDLSRAEAIDKAVEERTSGREGYFVLLSNSEGDEQEILDRYRKRNLSEALNSDLKTGIRIRPLYAKKWEAVRGRILVSYLGLLSICIARALVPKIQNMTAESIIDELRIFSLTVDLENEGEETAKTSNYTPIIEEIDDAFRSILSFKR